MFIFLSSSIHGRKTKQEEGNVSIWRARRSNLIVGHFLVCISTLLAMGRTVYYVIEQPLTSYKV